MKYYYIMKSVFVAGSRKFYEEIERLIEKLKENKIRVEKAGKSENTEEDTLESEKIALLNAFKKIDDFDILYVYSDNGYIGKTVAMEIAYAYARNKEIISSQELEEFSAQALISKIMNSDELIKYCKK